MKYIQKIGILVLVFGFFILNAKALNAQANTQEKVLVFGGNNASGVGFNDAWSSSGSLQSWNKVFPNANSSGQLDSQQTTWSATYLNGKIYAFGSGTYKLTWPIWSSSDEGVTWVKILNNGPWMKQGFTNIVSFNNKLWVINSQGSVWSSPDGTNWTQETNLPRNEIINSQNILVFQNKLWVFGGVLDNSVNTTIVPENTPADIWSSTDGTNWTQVAKNLPWWNRGRFGDTSVVFQNKMWIIGGGNGTTWSSPNGINWTQESTPEFAANTLGQALTYNNELYFFSGRPDKQVNRNKNLWVSSDGINWSEVKKNSAWSSRQLLTAIVVPNLDTTTTSATENPTSTQNSIVDATNNSATNTQTNQTITPTNVNTPISNQSITQTAQTTPATHTSFWQRIGNFFAKLKFW